MVKYEPEDEPPSIAVSSSKSTVLVNLAITFEPLPGAESKVIVVPETVKSSIGCNFLPSFLIASKCTLDG